MRRIPRLVYILLYLQCFNSDVFAFDVDVLSDKDTRDTHDIIWINKWECDSNDECTATNSTCSDHLCQCAPGYIYNADMTSCIKVATELYDSCEETLQCSAYLLSGARCINKVCVCGPGYYYLHGRCNRYVGLFEKCKRNIDCYVNADFGASVCANGICRCSPGFYQREYRTCRRAGKAVGEECTIDIDCTFNNAYCNKFKCAVKSQFEEAVKLLSNSVMNTNDFVDEQIQVGSNCTTNEDCRALGNAICDLAKTCRCDRAHFASDTGTKCIPELGESCQSNDVSDIKKAICREGIWSCTSDTVALKDNRECRKATRTYNGNCHQNEQCYVFGPDAECINKKCVCNENSHYVKGELFCWGNKGVGEACLQNQDCYVEGFKGELICKNDTCGCPDGTHLNKDKTACIDSSTGLGGVCEVDDDCATSNSVCKKEVCVCAKNYYQSEDRCLAGINSTCAINKDCTPESSVCISDICSCKPDYVAAAIDSCVPILSYGEPCSLDIQCFTNISGAICATPGQSAKNITDKIESLNIRAAENKVCTCNEKDHYKFGKCLEKKLIGETCTNIGECYIANRMNQNVMCMNGECKCNWDYVKWNSSVCVKNLRVVSFPNDSVTNMMSTGLLSIVLFISSCNFL